MPRTSFVAIENMVANSRPIVAAAFAALNAKQFAEKVMGRFFSSGIDAKGKIFLSNNFAHFCTVNRFF